ncbi:MAG: hypothetical protein N3D78_00325 [Candidatus Aenigmarchaeota archaeon]|nr:hypothetical protein [Candidatus Aenigmarchaeota archaeon]
MPRGKLLKKLFEMEFYPVNTGFVDKIKEIVDKIKINKAHETQKVEPTKNLEECEQVSKTAESIKYALEHELNLINPNLLPPILQFLDKLIKNYGENKTKEIIPELKEYLVLSDVDESKKEKTLWKLNDERVFEKVSELYEKNMIRGIRYLLKLMENIENKDIISSAVDLILKYSKHKCEDVSGYIVSGLSSFRGLYVKSTINILCEDEVIRKFAESKERLLPEAIKNIAILSSYTKNKRKVIELIDLFSKLENREMIEVIYGGLHWLLNKEIDFDIGPGISVLKDSKVVEKIEKLGFSEIWLDKVTKIAAYTGDKKLVKELLDLGEIYDKYIFERIVGSFLYYFKKGFDIKNGIDVLKKKEIVEKIEKLDFSEIWLDNIIGIGVCTVDKKLIKELLELGEIYENKNIFGCIVSLFRRIKNVNDIIHGISVLKDSETVGKIKELGESNFWPGEDLRKLLSYVVDLSTRTSCKDILIDYINLAERLVEKYGKEKEEVMEVLEKFLYFWKDRSKKDYDNEILKYTIDNLKDYSPRNKNFALKLFDTLPEIYHIFGENLYKTLLGYFLKEEDINSLAKIRNIYLDKIGDSNLDKIKETLEKIKIEENIGKKQIKRLVNFAGLLDLCYNFKVEVNVDGKSLQDAYKIVEENLKKFLNNKYGVEDLDLIKEFLPWFKVNSKVGIGVLKGEKFKKFTDLGRSYKIEVGDKDFNYEEILKELKSYNEKLKRIDGWELEIDENNKTLPYVHDVAREMMSLINRKKDWEKDEGMKKYVKGEVLPNLSRFQNLTKKYMSLEVYLNPSDLKTQMKALQEVKSCLSPGGGNFKYTEDYIKSENVFFGVIKSNGKIVGRFTVVNGYDESDKPALAIISNIHSHVPINEEEIKKAVEMYARENGAYLMERGELKIYGLEKIYDDRVKLLEVGSKAILAELVYYY